MNVWKQLSHKGHFKSLPVFWDTGVKGSVYPVSIMEVLQKPSGRLLIPPHNFRHPAEVGWLASCCSQSRVQSVGPSDGCLVLPYIKLVLRSQCSRVKGKIRLTLLPPCPRVCYNCGLQLRSICFPQSRLPMQTKKTEHRHVVATFIHMPKSCPEGWS